MALLLIAAASVSGVLLGEPLDAVAILTIVVVNAAIALVQEGRAERALEALAELEAPSATVVRDGRRQLIDARTLVPGDLVIVHAGDRVPADAAVVEGDSLEVDEAILTGESLPVSKRTGGATRRELPIGDRDGSLHAGTLVTRGTGRGRVIGTGLDTALGAIAEQLHDIRREPTPLQQQLAGLTRRLGLAAVAIAGGVFGLTLVVHGEQRLDEAFLTAVALAVAAVPEGLAAVTTVALALGVGRMAARGAIVRRLAAVETLGATDVLVIDKTGTVTENRMRVSCVVGPDAATHAPDAQPAWLRERVRRIVVLCSDATLDPPTGDPTERALLELAHDIDIEATRAATSRLGSAPFTSERKRMTTVHAHRDGAELLVKGAPDVVLPLVTRVLVDDHPLPLSDERRQQFTELTERLARRGERVLALASTVVPTVPGDVAGAEHDLALEALVTLRDPPRASASSSVATVRSAGLVLLMATGDHPTTAASIGAEVGIERGAALTGTRLRAEGLPADPTQVPIYARVDPDQKLQLVSRLQQLGHTVAMTGDGVNDAPALRRADIGVALGATGSDVAREAADLIITDNDLATIVEAIREGRGIWSNLRKVVDYLVSSNLAEVIVVVVTLLLVPALGVPLFPLQLLWINLLTDGLPALALGVDPVDPRVMTQRPRRRDSRLLDGRHLRQLLARAAVIASGGIVALLVAHHLLDFDQATTRTVLFSTLVLAQVVYAFVVRRLGVDHVEPNKWLRWAAGGAVVLHVLIVLFPPAQTIFDTVAPTTAGWLLTAACGLAAPLLLALRRS